MVGSYSNRNGYRGGETKQQTYSWFVPFFYVMYVYMHTSGHNSCYPLFNFPLPPFNQPDPTKDVCILAHTMKHVEIIGYLVVLILPL